jgi:hypothetical protein
MTPSDVLARQCAAWSAGDLEGFLAEVHPAVLYVNGTSVVSGKVAYGEQYEGRVEGELSVEIVDEVVTGDTAVLVVRARLSTDGVSTWRGRALLTLVREDGRWWLIGDATLSG